jgi:hypothetical protein
MRSFTKTGLAGLLILFVMANRAPAFESAYTDLVLDHCKTLVAPDDSEGGDFVSMVCPGYKTYSVLFKEGDLRQSLHYGFLSKTVIENAFESFGPFNNMNPKIEWRIDETGVPRAAIQRFFLSNINDDTGDADKEHQGQVLAISRVGQPGDQQGCVAGYVDALANPDANTLARNIADTLAPGFDCRKDQPEYHGIKGDKAADPTIYRGSE